jgi:hypothetical protein
MPLKQKDHLSTFCQNKKIAVAISHFLKFQAQAAINTLISVGVKEVLDAKIILPKKALKRDNRYQRDKKRKLCKRRAAIHNPTFCQNKKIAVAISHFLKFQAQAAINTLISSPTCPLSRFLDNLKSDFKCPIIGSMAARLLHNFLKP